MVDVAREVPVLVCALRIAGIILRTTVSYVLILRHLCIIINSLREHDWQNILLGTASRMTVASHESDDSLLVDSSYVNSVSVDVTQWLLR